MTEESKKLMQEQFGKLPPELQQALRSPKLSADIRKIGESNHLHIDQIGSLEDEVVYLLMGFTETGEITETLAKELNLTPSQAEQIVTAIGSQIIEPIRNSMKASDQEQKNPAPAPMPTKPVEIHPADMLLTQKSVSSAPLPAAPVPQAAPVAQPMPPKPATPSTPAAPAPAAEAPKPKPYSTDPYREPIQ